MAKAKMHLLDISMESAIPGFKMYEYRKQGLRGALCGYMRVTTPSAEDVTCFYCLKRLERSTTPGRFA